MSDTFQFTPVRMGCPYDNLSAAISIIQAEILASDTGLNPEVMFGNCHLKRAGLEAAVALLIGITDEVENVRWNGGAA